MSDREAIADRAVVRHALARGYLTLEQLRAALLLQEQLRAHDRPAKLLPLLWSRYLQGHDRAELADVWRIARGAAPGQPQQPVLDPGVDEIPTALLKRSGELLQRPPEQDPESVKRFLRESGDPTMAPPPSSPDRPADPGEASPQAKPEAAGQERVGPYLVERELARGGMGVVYVAWSEELQRRVALKLLLSGAQAQESEVQRFVVEARAAARLRHPGIVGVYDFGEDGGRPYFAMELVEGESLKQRLDRDGPLELREAARLTQKMSEALAYAHSHAILHRDMKPANVLINQQGEPVITDFGLAKDIEAGEGLTVTGQLMGTPAYMPPEQAEGNLELIDRRADVYSTGATLYALLTGRPPFEGASALNIITALLMKPVVKPSTHRPDLDRDLETICLKALEKEPEQRYLSAQHLADDLGRYLNDEAILARRPSVPERLRRLVRRNRRATAAVAVVLGLLAAGALYPMARAWRDFRRQARFEADVAAASAAMLAAGQELAAQAGQELSAIEGRDPEPERLVEIEAAVAGLEDRSTLRASLLPKSEAARWGPGVTEAAEPGLDAALRELGREHLLAHAERLRGDVHEFLGDRAEAAVRRAEAQGDLVEAAKQSAEADRHRAEADGHRAEAYRADPGGQGARALLDAARYRAGSSDEDELRRALGLFRALAGRALPALRAAALLGLSRVAARLGEFDLAATALWGAAATDPEVRWLRAVHAALAGRADASLSSKTWLEVHAGCLCETPCDRDDVIVPVGDDGVQVFRWGQGRLRETLRLRAGGHVSSLGVLPGRRLALALGADGGDSLNGSLEIWEAKGEDWKRAYSHDLSCQKQPAHRKILAVDDVDGDGVADVVFAIWGSERREILTLSGADLSAPPREIWRAKAGESRFPDLGFAMADVDGDGQREAIFSLGSWNDYRPLIGRAKAGRYALDQTLPRVGVTNWIVRSRASPEEVYLATDRGDDQAGLADPAFQATSDAVYRLGWAEGKPVLKSLWVSPHPDPERIVLTGLLPLGDLIQGYPGALALVERESDPVAKQHRHTLLLFREPGPPPTRIGLARGLEVLATGDLDGDGDAELILAGGDQLSVLGLAGRESDTSPRDEELAPAVPTELGVILDLLEGGLIEASSLAKSGSSAEGTERQRGQLDLVRARALADSGDLAGARQRCRSLARRQPVESKGALLQAASYAEAGGDYMAALADLRQVVTTHPLSDSEGLEVARRRARLEALVDLAPALELDPSDLTVVRAPLLIRPTPSGLRFLLGYGLEPVVELPLLYDGRSFRIRATLRVQQLEWDSGLRIRLAEQGRSEQRADPPHELVLGLNCGGGGNAESLRRSVPIRMLGESVTRLSLPGYDPTLPVEVEVTYLAPERRVMISIEHGNESLEVDTFLPQALNAGRYLLSIGDQTVQGPVNSGLGLVTLERLEFQARSLGIRVDEAAAAAGREQGLSQLALGEPGRALEAFAAHVRDADPDQRVRAGVLSAMAEARLGRHADAVSRLQALRSVEGDERLLAFWEPRLFALRDTELAALAEAWCGNQPDLQQRGLAHVQAGRNARAALFLQVAGPPTLELGLAWIRAGAFERALACFEGSQRPDARWLSGWAAYRAGDYPLALKRWKGQDLPALQEKHNIAWNLVAMENHAKSVVGAR